MNNYASSSDVAFTTTNDPLQHQSPSLDGDGGPKKPGRGRRRDDSLPYNRARDVQRAFRARRAAHLDSLERRVKELEEENTQLREALRMPPSSRYPIGTGPTGRGKLIVPEMPPSRPPDFVDDDPDQDRSPIARSTSTPASYSPDPPSPTIPIAPLNQQQWPAIDGGAAGGGVNGRPPDGPPTAFPGHDPMRYNQSSSRDHPPSSFRHNAAGPSQNSSESRAYDSPTVASRGPRIAASSSHSTSLAPISPTFPLHEIKEALPVIPPSGPSVQSIERATTHTLSPPEYAGSSDGSFYEYTTGPNVVVPPSSSMTHIRGMLPSDPRRVKQEYSRVSPQMGATVMSAQGEEGPSSYYGYSKPPSNPNWAPRSDAYLTGMTSNHGVPVYTPSPHQGQADGIWNQSHSHHPHSHPSVPHQQQHHQYRSSHTLP